jgi:hypothetical protein
MARTKGRVVLTQNPKEHLDLAKKIYNKHVALGAASPLLLLEDVDWAVTGVKIDPTITAHTDAEFHKGEMEKNYVKRDQQLPEISKALKQSINLLKATYGTNPKKLTDWGVSVDDAPKAPKTK